MNKIEKIVYDLVKSNPAIKNLIRNTYQSMFDLLPDKEDFFRKQTVVKEGFFFGFHDCSPFSQNEKYILANKLLVDLHMPVENEMLEVGYWNSNFSEYTVVDKTKAWNYHKGCRLQWLGETNDKFIFNDYENEHYVSKIYSLLKKNIIVVDFPIDTISSNGKYATSFSYERLNRYMPGYGYLFSDEPFFEENSSDKTGLYLCDIENNEKKLIVSLRELSEIIPNETMNGAHHFVTHTQFSPDGSRIAFLHRWTYGDNPDKRYSRLVTCKLDGSDIRVSCTTGMVSHFDWNHKHGILAYCQVDGQDGHYIFPDYKMESAKRVGASLNSDGHQSYVTDTDYFVTDTYPDKRRRSKIYLVNIKTDEVELLVDVKSPKKFQSPDVYHHWACDLHPRISPDANWLCFDSSHTGSRALCLMPLNMTKVD